MEIGLQLIAWPRHIQTQKHSNELKTYSLLEIGKNKVREIIVVTKQKRHMNDLIGVIVIIFILLYQNVGTSYFSMYDRCYMYIFWTNL